MLIRFILFINRDHFVLHTHTPLHYQTTTINLPIPCSSCTSAVTRLHVMHACPCISLNLNLNLNSNWFVPKQKLCVFVKHGLLYSVDFAWNFTTEFNFIYCCLILGIVCITWLHVNLIVDHSEHALWLGKLASPWNCLPLTQMKLWPFRYIGNSDKTQGMSLGHKYKTQDKTGHPKLLVDNSENAL